MTKGNSIVVKNVYIRTILYLFVIIACLCRGSVLAQLSDNNQRKVKVGKENPFVKLPEKKKEFLAPRKISVASDIGAEQAPEMFVKVATLKSLDAASFKAAIENLSSEYGSISVDEKSNSLIICDTQERLEKILVQIHSNDEAASQQVTAQNQPMLKLVAESVTLRFLDPKNLKAAIEKMSSEYGSISTIEKTNSLIVCDTQENLEMILAEIKKIDKPTPGLLVETVTLKFLKAKNLKKAIDSMSSRYGSIATDDTTNSLIICDVNDKLKKIIAEIKKADRTPKQIMIEVVILDVQLENDTEIGVNWDSVFGASADEQYTQALNTLTTGATFSIIKTDISATLKALQEKRSVEILASPRVLVVSGHEAYIKTIEEIPYDEISETTGSDTLTSTKFKEIGITLKVKATITDRNRIMMTIEPEQSIDAGIASTTSGSDVPKVDKRAAKTTLLMEDGQIVIMGGLRKKEKQIIRTQVPLLGDLPLVGFLFANNKEVTKYSELIVMISPHIQNGNGLNNEQMKKFNELKNMPMLSLPNSDYTENGDDIEDALQSILNLLEK